MQNNKKLFSILLIGFFFLGKISFGQENHGPVHWMTFNEAVEKCKKEPRMIMIDIYTTWCGPCKMLSKQTFGNDTIAKYLNDHFYCVKYDAENHDTLKFTMTLPDTIKDKAGKVKKVGKKNQEYKFYNAFPLDAQRSTHQFVASILQGKQIAFPSLVFLTKDLNDGNIKRVDVIQGFFPPANFEPIMKFYGSGIWQTVKWEDFMKTFQSEFKAK